MLHSIRTVALATLASHILLQSATCQIEPAAIARVTLPNLLLPATPTIGYLRFDANGDFDLTEPVTLDAYATLSPIHQRMLVTAAGRPSNQAMAFGCWLTPPTQAAATLFNATIEGPLGFQPIQRWSATATNGGGLSQGDPTTLRYSFVPDGTFIPNGVGEGSGNSNMFSSFNGAFASQATWQNRIHDALQRWGDLIGVTYIYEPNDDGASMFGASGVIGVRGDVRIAAKFIDGGSGILAYNFFPNQGGDMVFDSGDTGFFATPTSNYRRLFNVTGHEHGHGLGIAHVCPANNTKLMEPFITTAFNGPQFDDILSGQRLYGDRLEDNDSTANATDLGSLPNGVTTVSNVSIDGSSDIDSFLFTVPSNKLLTATLSPAGTTYLEGPQVGNCTTGSSFNPATLRNLGLLLLNGAGTQLLAFELAQPAGVAEVISGFALTAGSYLVRVTGSGADTIQMYSLALNIVDNGDVAAANPVGTGCGGIAWDALNRPLLGSTTILRLQNIPAPAQSIGLILLGTTAIPGGLDLTVLGAPGCFVYQDTLDILTVFPLPGTSFIHLLPIPNVLALSGASIWTQGGLLVPPGTNALGAITANAIELVLGTQ